MLGCVIKVPRTDIAPWLDKWPMVVQ